LKYLLFISNLIFIINYFMVMKKLLLLLLLLTPLAVKATESTVLINEIAWMGTQNSANDEWLELYNSTNAEIDLTGWRLEADDGSPKINLAGKISASGYFLLERTDDETVPQVTAGQIYSGSLGNTGEWLKLYDNGNNLIDEVNALDGWPGGDNDTKKTLERADLTAWQTSINAGGTPGAQNGLGDDTSTSTATNQEQNDEPEAALANTNQAASDSGQKGDIIFNELLPIPAGTDDQEFIEIKNNSQKTIDLTGWKITTLAKQNYILPSLIMTPKSMVVFWRSATNLALNNENEKITLYSASGKIIDQIAYKTAAPEDQSYQRTAEGKWLWDKTSPNQENIAKIPILPAAVINGPKTGLINEFIDFDASDSFDPLNRPLNFFWQFGDGRLGFGLIGKQSYLYPGNYQVILTAIVKTNGLTSPDQASSTQNFFIKITDPNSQSKNNATSSTGNATSTGTGLTNDLAIMPEIYLAEFLPNPADQGSQEFIELFSQENQPFDLGGFKLDDAEGGSKPYTIPVKTIIRPDQYLAFFADQTKIALNNTDDSARLIAPNGQIIDLITYQKTAKGKSFVLDQDFSWQESETPTPGQANFFNVSSDQNSALEEAVKPKVLGVQTQEQNSDNDTPANQPTNKNQIKYFVAAIFSLVILAIVAFIKAKKSLDKNQKIL
jgi:hypothetical protein